MTAPDLSDEAVREVCAYLHDLGSTPYDHKVAAMLRSLLSERADLTTQVAEMREDLDAYGDREEEALARAEAAEARVAALTAERDEARASWLREVRRIGRLTEERDALQHNLDYIMEQYNNCRNMRSGEAEALAALRQTHAEGER